MAKCIMTIEDFILRFDGFSSWDPQKQVDYFCYYLTTEANKKSITAKDIQDCFHQVSLRNYKRLPQYLSENAGDSKHGRYVKFTVGGYRLERQTFDEIKIQVDNEPTKIQVSTELTNLIQKIKNTNEKSFLIEAINCYRVRTYRATIVLIWILAIDHLQNYIFGNKLNEFNIALAKNPDKKISKIIYLDNFGELKESKFIEIAKSARIISNDIRKILDEKLGIRNSAAHPSGIMFSGHKATEFALDLINNILIKY